MPVSPDCTIAKPSKPEFGRLCWEPTCRAHLPPRAQKWCLEHRGGMFVWQANHMWSEARDLAIRAACQRKHTTPSWEPDEAPRHRPWLTGSRGKGFPELACQPVCAMCGEVTEAPEVDHIVPMNGDVRHVADCRNHQTNLRVLCHDCHKARTAQQRRAQALQRQNEKRGKDAQRTFFAWDAAAFISGKAARR
jgi:5-methylcytosine-specific restriction endonuclease McrA